MFVLTYVFMDANRVACVYICLYLHMYAGMVVRTRVSTTTQRCYVCVYVRSCVWALTCVNIDIFVLLCLVAPMQTFRRVCVYAHKIVYLRTK